jgi:hypothetical protein
LPKLSVRSTRASLVVAGSVIALSAAVVTPVVAQAGTSSKPSVSGLQVSPQQPVAGKGFKVTFTTHSGGDYTVYFASSANGGPLAMGKAKPGSTITTKKLGQSLHAIKGLTIGVMLTVGKTTKRATTTITIVK